MLLYSRILKLFSQVRFEVPHLLFDYDQLLLFKLLHLLEQLVIVVVLHFLKEFPRLLQLL